MKRLTTSLLLCIGLSVWFSGSTFAQEVLTLERALEIAYKNSPKLRTSKISLEQQELNLVRQKASLKSQFSFDLTPISYSRRSSYQEYQSEWTTNKNLGSSGNFSIIQPILWTGGSVTLKEGLSWLDASNLSQGGSNTSFTNNLSLNLEQPIFKANELKIKLKETEFNFENAKLNYAIEQLNIEKSVTDEFYGLYQSHKSLINQRENYIQAKKTYDLTKIMVEQDTRPKIDLLQQETEFAQAEIDLANAETSFETTKDNFKLLLGLPLEENIMVLPNTETDSVYVNENLAIQYALTQRMQLRQQEISIQKGFFDLIRAKETNKFGGTISATVGITSRGANLKGAFQKPDDDQNININLSIPVFDWGVRKAAIRSAELGNESLEMDLEDSKKQIVIEIRQICRNIPKLYKQIAIAKKKMENNEIIYNNYYEQYLAGTLSSKDMQQYQRDLTNAKQAYTDAIISYKKELLNLKIQTLWDFKTNTSYLPVDLLK